MIITALTFPGKYIDISAPEELDVEVGKLSSYRHLLATGDVVRIPDSYYRFPNIKNAHQAGYISVVFEYSCSSAVSGVSGWSGAGSGSSGGSSSSGESGWSGWSGLGFSGPPGESGWSGASAWSGWTGFSGRVGESGFSGGAGEGDDAFVWFMS
jgi:hypothetical protein